MTPTPLVTVLMTAFNRERYIAAAIESVLSQAFTDFELIVVDDASTDATMEIARRYDGDPRVRLIVNGRNLGDYPNRNHAASFARGAFLKYHDSDDIMYPHCLEVMVSSLRSAPDAAAALSSGRNWSGGPCPMLLTPHMAFQREYLGQGLFHVGPAGALFRREAFEAVGGYPEAGVHSDAIFWVTFCATFSVLLVAADLFWYRTHAGQQLTSSVAVRDRLEFDRRSWSFLSSPRCPLSAGEREQARRNRTALTAKHLIGDVRRADWRLAWYRFRGSGPRLVDWLRYARFPRRDLNAGSPRDASGDFVVPPSLRLQGERTPRTAGSR